MSTPEHLSHDSELVEWVNYVGPMSRVKPTQPIQMILWGHITRISNDVQQRDCDMDAYRYLPCKPPRSTVSPYHVWWMG